MSTQLPNAHQAKRARLGERTMLACTGCKQKKLKCDGQTPRCQNCARSERDCLVEDPATGLHRPRDYLKSLESRVAYLESLLQQTRPEVALDHLGGANATNNAQITDPRQNNGSDHFGVEGNQVYDVLNSSSFDQASQEAARDAEDEHIDDLSTEVALLCLSAAGREPHYFGPSCAVSFSRIVSTTMGLPRRTVSSHHSSGLPEVHAPEVERTVSVLFPSRPLAATLSHAYFKNIHPQYPFLHKPTFLAWEELCTRANIAGDVTTAGDLALFFILMVYAIGSLALGPAHRDSAEAYYTMALKHQGPVLDLDGLESIQSILCCAVYSVRSPVGVSLWKLSGMAIRHCIELGYHRNVSRYRKHTDPLSAEMSTRCFWVAYDLDRVAAFNLGRPVGIPDHAIDVKLPLDLEDEYITKGGMLKASRSSINEPPTYMTGAIHVIKLRRLWSKFSDNLFPTTTKPFMLHSATSKALLLDLRRELVEWYAEIPDPASHSGTHPLSVFASKAWYQLAYDHSFLLLYRHFITLPMPRGEENSVEKAFEECAYRARDMCLLYRRLYQSPTIQFTWGSLHILFVGGLTYLYCLWKSNRVRALTKRSDVINTCMACNTVLVIIAERWSQATAYRDTFETLSEKTIEMICNDGAQATKVAHYITPFSESDLGAADPTTSQDWIAGLDDIIIPHDSEWLVQEVLQGMRDFQHPDLPLDDYVNLTG